MRPNDFVHLHVHTHFSLLDGNCQLDQLLDRVRGAGQDALAITDHGNLFGAVNFYKAAKNAEVKPILGMEAYVATGTRFEKKRVVREGRRKATYHATLLAATNEGWQNLMRLATTAFVDGFYYKPRIDRDAMKEWGKGLICLSGCLAGEVNQAILAGKMDEAESIVREYQELFGSENFYLEVMDHGIELEHQVLGPLGELSRATGVPLVATNDIHYVDAPDWKAQDVALCIGTGKVESDPDRFRMRTRELYFKDTATMAEIFKDHPGAISSTREIADRCNVELGFANRYLPAFSPPKKETPESYFRRLCTEGLARRYPTITDTIQARLDDEIKVIVSMGFVDYFLITWDFIRHAREQGIPVGPGRGSAAGSIVSYVLNITDLDPLRYDLLFERFLNSERISMPDIDIDFCKDRRNEVIEYVQEKYGRDHVAQIITFGTMKARAVIRDVGRVLDVPLAEVNRIAKKIPNGPKDTLAKAVENDEEVKRISQESEQNQRLFDIALRLEGNARHASIHAAGVVISDRPLSERVPLYRAGEDITTQWTMDVLEEIGLLKVDFLGLRTLTIIKEAVDNIEKTIGQRIDMSAIPLDDKKTFSVLSRGDACGVFQLESDGMKDLLRRLKPDRFEDLVAVLALYRPGPLGSGMVDTYVRRKHGEEPIEYLHPSIESILKESLGVILYQEQVMRIANVLSGFSLNESDNLRKAMGKKKPEILAKFKNMFVDGAVRNGVEERVAAEIFDLIEYFAGYGFNKSHSAAYALITYQTAWLKANYPVEFMAGLLSCEMIQIEKTVEYTEECRAMKIEILPPDVNASFGRFAVENGKIRFALAAVKGVGETAILSLALARKEKGAFKTVFDLCERVDCQKLNRAALEALIFAGAFDSLEGKRSQQLAVLDDALAVGSAAERDRRSGQGSLFGLEDFEAELERTGTSLLPAMDELPEQERLQKEKDVLGFYLTGHPLNRVLSEVKQFSTATISGLSNVVPGTKVVLGGIICGIRVVVIKQGRNAGQKMAILRFEDFTGTCEAVVFSDLYAQMIDRIHEDKICFFEGEVDFRRDEANLRISAIHELDEARYKLTRKVTLRVGHDDDLDLVVPAVKRVLKGHPGSMPVFFDLRVNEGAVTVRADDEYRVNCSAMFLADMEKILGFDRIRLN